MSINVTWIVCDDVPEPLSHDFHFLDMWRYQNDATLMQMFEKSEFGFKKRKEKKTNRNSKKEKLPKKRPRPQP